jgi:hypothetical protein
MHAQHALALQAHASDMVSEAAATRGAACQCAEAIDGTTSPMRSDGDTSSSSSSSGSSVGSSQSGSGSSSGIGKSSGDGSERLSRCSKRYAGGNAAQEQVDAAAADVVETIVSSHKIDGLSGSFAEDSLQLSGQSAQGLDTQKSGHCQGLLGGSQAASSRATVDKDPDTHQVPQMGAAGAPQLGSIQTRIQLAQRDISDGVQLSSGALLEPVEIQTGFEPVRGEASGSGTPLARQAPPSIAKSSSQISRYFAMQAANVSPPPGTQVLHQSLIDSCISVHVHACCLCRIHAPGAVSVTTSLSSMEHCTCNTLHVMHPCFLLQDALPFLTAALGLGLTVASHFQIRRPPAPQSLHLPAHPRLRVPLLQSLQLQPTNPPVLVQCVQPHTVLSQ